MQELAAKVKRLEDEKNNLELKFGEHFYCFIWASG